MDELLLRAPVIDVEGDVEFEDVVLAAAEQLAHRTDQDPDELAETFIEENQLGMMPVVSGAAFRTTSTSASTRPRSCSPASPTASPSTSTPPKLTCASTSPSTPLSSCSAQTAGSATHYRLLAHLAGRFEEVVKASAGIPARETALAFFSDELFSDPRETGSHPSVSR